MIEVGKLAALALVSALCALMIRKQTPELALILVCATGAMILLCCVPGWSAMLMLVDELAQMGSLSSDAISTMLKTSGIALVTHMTSEICKDAGEGGLAGMVETAGQVMAMVSALPLLMSLLSTLDELL